MYNGVRTYASLDAWSSKPQVRKPRLLEESSLPRLLIRSPTKAASDPENSHLVSRELATHEKSLVAVTCVSLEVLDGYDKLTQETVAAALPMEKE